MTLREIAVKAAETAWWDWQRMPAPRVDRHVFIANAVAVAVLREVQRRKMHHAAGVMEVIVANALAEFDAPGAQPEDNRMQPNCMDCGRPYSKFPLDLLFPRSQWCEILSQTRENPCADDNDGGLLCAQCMVTRAARVPGATCVQAVIEINPHPPLLSGPELTAITKGLDDIKHGRFKSLAEIDQESDAPGAQEKEKNDGTTEEDQVQALETHSGREEADRPSRATGAGTTSSVAPAGVADVEAVAPEPTQGAQETQCQDRLGMGGKTYQCALLEGHKGMHAHDPMIMWSTPDQGAQERNREPGTGNHQGAQNGPPQAQATEESTGRLSHVQAAQSQRRQKEASHQGWAEGQSGLARSTASGTTVGGDASRGDIEIRYEPPDGQNISAIDEVVANDAHVHLERMDRGQWSLIIESKTQRACFMINGKDVARSLVTTQLFWIDPVGSVSVSTSAERADATRRSAAQKSISHSRPSLTEET